MEQRFILDFLKELSVGFKSAKSYPPGHPVMEKVVASTIGQLSNMFVNYPEFSFYFLEKTIIFQDIRIDISKNLAVLSFIEALRKNDIESLTFCTGAKAEDVKNLYEVMSSSKLKIKEYGDAAGMLQSKGTEKIKINAVKFGIQSGATSTVQVAQKTEVSPSAESKDIAEAIKDFQELIKQGVDAVLVKNEFGKIVANAEGISVREQMEVSEAVARILENLPYEHRVELFRTMELKPFVLKILSNLDEERLVEMVVTRSDNSEDAKKVLGALKEDKFTKLLPMLQERIPNFYEYLAKIGLMLSERLTSLFSKEDLYNSIRPYYSMLESQNARVREEGIKSLSMLADRFVRQGYIEIAEEITGRLASALEQEPVPEVVGNAIGEIYNLFNVASSNKQEKVCNAIAEPFNRILGRPGLSMQLKKIFINFMGETRSPKFLPSLLSFLWETGVYPEVRAAIIKIGKEAVSELLYTLREADDYSLRMKIIDILKNIGEDGLETLLKHIDAPEWYLRRNILTVISEIGTAEVCPRLEVLINDPDDRIRLELVRTFIKLNYETGLKLLLRDSAIEVRAEALRGLRKTISNQEVIELVSSFKEKSDAFNTELLRIIGERRLKELFGNIVDYLKNLALRDDQVAQELKRLGVSTMIRLATPELRNVLAEFVHSNDKFLADLCQTALKRMT